MGAAAAVSLIMAQQWQPAVLTSRVGVYVGKMEEEVAGSPTIQARVAVLIPLRR